MTVIASRCRATSGGELTTNFGRVPGQTAGPTKGNNRWSNFLCLTFSAVFFLFCRYGEGTASADEAELWRALHSGNHFVLLRHAMAPGTGDPPHFLIGDCASQRNLSAEGRKQAAQTGERFRANGISRAKVFSSQWCRCLETAHLLTLGPVQELPALNSFFQRNHLRETQTQALREWLLVQDFTVPLILVTHQVNITAFIGISPAPGQVVIVRRTEDGRFLASGSMAID